MKSGPIFPDLPFEDRRQFQFPSQELGKSGNRQTEPKQNYDIRKLRNRNESNRTGSFLHKAKPTDFDVLVFVFEGSAF